MDFDGWYGCNVSNVNMIKVSTNVFGIATNLLNLWEGGQFKGKGGCCETSTWRRRKVTSLAMHSCQLKSDCPGLWTSNIAHSHEIGPDNCKLGSENTCRHAEPAENA